VGEATPSELQPASTRAPSAAAAMSAGRRTAQDSNEPLSLRAGEPVACPGSVPFRA
jgi:hypothetical protein